MDKVDHHSRMIILSNRLPVLIEKKENGINEVVEGSGGLITALAPVLKNRGGLWIGWSGAFSEDVTNEEAFELFAKAKINTGFALYPLQLQKKEAELYYEGFSNEVVWPLFHDMLSQCKFHPEYWESYANVNKKFANAVLNTTREGDFLWVHDYHLLLIGQEIRKERPQLKTSFFLHIPFPSLDMFIKLPWRFQILRALLAFDFVCFQTYRDRRNFINCARILLTDTSTKFHNIRSMHIYRDAEREVRITSLPISIDFKEFARLASSQPVAEQAWLLHENWPEQQIIFSLDRLDYTKGLPNRLEAIRFALKKYPELHRKVCFVQVVIPSRTNIPGYQHLKDEIDRLVGEINSQFTQAGWVPIHYFYRSLKKEELLSFYRMAEIVLVTSLKDGMNLVCKEFIASKIEENGVLILSEFAGAAAELQKNALMINPFDIEGVAEAIYMACTMGAEERKLRMQRMRRLIKRHDIFWWVVSFLRGAISKKLVDFPIQKEYLPSEST